MNKIDWKYAPEWADSVRKTLSSNGRFWCNDNQYLIFGNYINATPIPMGSENQTGSLHYFTPSDFELIQMRPDPWKEGAERMEPISRNGNEGEHYDEIDNVNHPEHYQSDNGIECIDAIRAALGHDGFIAYCRGNTIKYNWRSDSKGKHAEDLKKGAWYSNKAAAELEKSK
jgi:hypothetical protein